MAELERGCSEDAVASRVHIHRQCLDAIRRSDVVFVWVDSLTAYGTLVEAGFAAGLGKEIWLAHDGQLYPDMWFLFQTADRTMAADTPKEALHSLLRA